MRDAVRERFELFIGGFQLRGALDHTLLELILSALEILILLLNARQHAVEGFDQLADFIAALYRRPNRIIFVARHFRRNCR